MALLPTPVKTWNYGTSNANVNQRYKAGTYQTDYQRLWYGIKEALKSTNGGAWTVRSSSNGTTASAADNWSSSASLNWNTTSLARSWIVLRNTSIGSTFDICFDFTATSTGDYYGLKVYCAPGGYATTSLVTTARPGTTVASDEITLTTLGSAISFAAWGAASSNFVFHVLQSTDGQCTRIVIQVNDAVVGFMLFDKANTTLNTTQWPVPFVYMIHHANGPTDQLTVAKTYTGSGFNTRFTTSGNTVHSLFGSAESYSANLLTTGIQVANEFTQEFPLLPIGLVSTTSPYRGQIGSVYDLWQGVSNMMAGTCYPANNTRTFAQFGCLVMPWNGSVPVTR